MRIAKYFTTFRNVFQDQLEYRAKTIIRFLIAMIVLISTLYLWSDVFSDRAQIAGYTKEQIITYYILVAFFFAAVFTSLTVAEEIKTGQLSIYVTRPISYIYFYYWYDLARKVFRLIIGLPVLIAIFFLFRDYIFFVTDPRSYLLLLFTLFSAINLLFLIELLINFLEFWFSNSWGMATIFDVSIGIFAGTLIPLAFLPNWLNAIGNFLPFKYTGAFLVDSFLGKMTSTEIITGIAMQIFWTLALLLLAKLAWHKGLKKYEAFGS